MVSTTEGATERVRQANISMSIGVLGIGAALALAAWLAPVLTPIAIAWLGKIALSTPLRKMGDMGVRPPIAAAVIVTGILAAVASSGYLLAEPALGWVERLPADVERLGDRWRELQQPVGEIAEVTHAVEELVEEAGAAGDGEVVEVRIAESTPAAMRWLGVARGPISQALLVLVLLYFMLASDSVLVRKMEAIAGSDAARDRARAISKAVEVQCSRYLLSISVINVALGFAVGLAVGALGLPNPALWGTVAALLNFIPIVGAAVGIGTVAVVALSSMDSATAALLPPLAYLALTTVEGLFVTPAVVGRTISLSPVAVVTWLMVWGWLWGLPGAILAVPMLATLVIVCRHVPRWRAVATLLEA